MTNPDRHARRCGFWATLYFWNKRKGWVSRWVDVYLDVDGNFEVDGRVFHIDAIEVNVDQDGFRSLNYMAYEEPWVETRSLNPRRS